MKIPVNKKIQVLITRSQAITLLRYIKLSEPKRYPGSDSDTQEVNRFTAYLDYLVELADSE